MRKRIMIIEEDMVELNKLSLLLDLKGYEVCPVHQSYKILTEISRCRPDLILMDSVLGTMNTMAVSRVLQSLDTVKDIPLMMILGKDYDQYTYACKGLENLYKKDVKTTDLDHFLHDIDLKLAS
jgi:DNA-binding response OmpR family regulator